MGQFDELEYRLSSFRPCDKLGESCQGFRGKFVNETELVLSDDDTPGGTFEGGKKCLQLFGAIHVSNAGVLGLEADLHFHVSSSHLVNCVRDQIS